MATTKLKGNIVNLSGNELNIGDKAPEVTVIAHDLSEVKIGGKAQIIAAVPSLDTPVCAEETRKFNEEASTTDVEMVVVSMDLPFAAGRFCTTEGIENLKVGSDFRNKEFAQKYGVLIADGPLEGVTCRAMFVTDENGIIIHKEICEDITDEPNYEAVFTAIKK
ncbi:thiol peroxidase [Halarcobacter bivalviorum]|uniref:Lipid hydroperoxide peroxidase n=1 Tax=Halarcobacter bivalviorum TaxID=663364 RepID=A0AAX2A5K8_9BACT|nr:thiol peroxidase [Halarcobacter bivalviorum]AXH12918.1 lipid hydroperoxide peroxidase [Halarcobacter bivalviorum]RXK08842.1 lipid hydroperoxide peroxidase [Halarcobacter bivalviorum]